MIQTVEDLFAHYKAVKARLRSPVKKTALDVKVPTSPEPIIEAKTSLPLMTKSEMIIREILMKYKITKADLLSHKKSKAFVQARFECAYRLSSELNLATTAIARIMNRDHTSIVHARRKYKKKLDKENEGNQNAAS